MGECPEPTSRVVFATIAIRVKNIKAKISVVVSSVGRQFDVSSDGGYSHRDGRLRRLRVRFRQEGRRFV